MIGALLRYINKCPSVTITPVRTSVFTNGETNEHPLTITRTDLFSDGTGSVENHHVSQ